MAVARQRAEWLRIAGMVCWIGPAVWGKEPLKPERVIPKEYRPPKPVGLEMSPEEKAEQSRRGWHVMNRFFGKPNKKMVT